MLSHVENAVQIHFVFVIIFKELVYMDNTLPDKKTQKPHSWRKRKSGNRNLGEGQHKEQNGAPPTIIPPPTIKYKHFIWKDSTFDGWQMHSKENLHTYCIAMKCAHQSSSSAIYRARVQEAVLGLRINELLRKAGNESIPATNYQRDVQEQNAEYYDKLTHLFSDANIANEEIEKQLKDIRTSTTNAIRDLKKKYQLKEKANPASPKKVSDATGEEVQDIDDDPHQQAIVFRVERLNMDDDPM
jgi:hypothetical protein